MIVFLQQRRALASCAVCVRFVQWKCVTVGILSSSWYEQAASGSRPLHGRDNTAAGRSVLLTPLGSRLSPSFSEDQAPPSGEVRVLTESCRQTGNCDRPRRSVDYRASTPGGFLSQTLVTCLLDEHGA